MRSSNESFGKNHYVQAVASALDGWFGPAWVEPDLLGLAGHIDEVLGEIRRAQLATVRLILDNPTEYDDLTMDHLWHAKSMSEQKFRLIGELWCTLQILDLWEDFISAYGRLSRGVCDDEGVCVMESEHAIGAKTDQEILDVLLSGAARFGGGDRYENKGQAAHEQAGRLIVLPADKPEGKPVFKVYESLNSLVFKEFDCEGEPILPFVGDLEIGDRVGISGFTSSWQVQELDGRLYAVDNSCRIALVRSANGWWEAVTGVAINRK